MTEYTFKIVYKNINSDEPLEHELYYKIEASQYIYAFYVCVQYAFNDADEYDEVKSITCESMVMV